jgi:hypothetical protein
MTGVCGLCRQTRVLQESHLLPRAAYNHIREPMMGWKGNPVSITPRKTQITSKQTKDPFLCRDCDQRFGKRGENHILTQCVHQDGQFSLREQLQAAIPLDTEKLSTVYDAVSLLGQEIDAYLYHIPSHFVVTS